MEAKGVVEEKKKTDSEIAETEEVEKNEKKKTDGTFFQNLKRKLTWKRIVAIILLCVIGYGIWYFFWGGYSNQENTATGLIEYTVVKDSITETIEQSGVIEPFERYEITSRVMGEIIESPFEEGDYVNEGDTLYRIDDEDAQLNIEKADNNISKAEHNIEKSESGIDKAENNIEKAQNAVIKAQNNVEKAQKALNDVNDEIAKLNIYASASGKLTDFALKENDTVVAMTVGRIENTDVRTIEIPFFLDDFSKINVGDSVTLTSALYMESLPGTVTHKYESENMGSGGSGAHKMIEVEIKNPKSLDSNSTFSAIVHTKSGDVSSAASGAVNAGETTAVKAETSGTVSHIAVKNGDYVKKGQLIMKMTNDTLMSSKEDCERALSESKLSLNEAKMTLDESTLGREESNLNLSDSQLSLEDSELSKKSTEKALEDYNITAPISGTVITKNSKVGDNINNSSGQTVMMVIADTSKMKFTINVDELDISKIKLGQTAMVDADALPDEMFEAKVTSIAGEGESNGNGVTTFTVELTIDEPGNLRSGMNVNANVLINEAFDILKIPEDALTGVRGTKATVMVKSQGNNNSDTSDGKIKDTPEADDNNAENVPNENGYPKQHSDKADNTGGQGGRSTENLPEGVEMRTIEIGISDGTFIEVVSGLSEGEIVVYSPVSTNTGDDFNKLMTSMMSGGGAPGGMGGGRAPGGGGAPGGSGSMRR